MSRRWYDRNEEETPPVFVAIGMAAWDEAVLRVWSTEASQLWDIEMSIAERVAFVREVREKGWRLDLPLG